MVVERLTNLEDEADRASAELDREYSRAAAADAAMPRADMASISSQAPAVRGPVETVPPASARSETSKTDLAALRELAGGKSSLDQGEKPGNRRADFIAAARRAAQSAAAEAAAAETQDNDPEPDEPRQGAFSRIGQAIRNRRRPLLLAAAAIVLAIGAVQYFGQGSGYPGAVREDDTVVSSATPKSTDRIADASATSVPAMGATATDAAAVPTIPKTSDTALVAPAEAPAEVAFAPASPVANHFSNGTDAVHNVEATAADTVAEAAPAVNDSNTIAATPASLSAPAADVPANPDLAIASTKLRDAVVAGDPSAYFEVAVRYSEGRGVKADMSKAATWYKKAAESGVAVAQYRLGSLYERGQGVKRDLATAVMWYQRAADQGNIGAMHNLAVLLSEGVDGSPDHVKALQWFRAAGNYGVKDSQYNLGVLYARGIGTDADLVESYKWFAAAAAQGDTDAATRRDQVAQMMKPDDLAKARAAYQAWHAKTPLAEANSVVSPPGGWDTLTAGITDSDRSGLVKKIQVLLAQQGYDPGPSDGIEGPKTREAVKAYQNASGMTATGKIDRNLVAVLTDPSN